MKLRIKSAAAFALSVAAAMPGTAATILTDNFNRGDSNLVGNGWTEVEPQPSDVRLHGQVVELTDIGSQILQASGVSTVGFDDITLGYDWARIGNTEAGDAFAVEWRDGSLAGAWTLLGMHSLDGSGTAFTGESVSLLNAGGLTDLEFRFRNLVTGNNEGLLLDNIVLSGTPLIALQQQQVPEPGSFALAGIAVVLLALSRRKPSRV
jgi:hypothetical protein